MSAVNIAQGTKQLSIQSQMERLALHNVVQAEKTLPTFKILSKPLAKLD